VSEPRTLKERAVARVGAVEVGVANVMEDRYVLPDGREASGMTAELIPLEREEGNPRHTVGPGSVVELGGVRVEVLDVQEGTRGDGRVTIREL
jgi:hypothetical protein